MSRLISWIIGWVLMIVFIKLIIGLVNFISYFLAYILGPMIKIDKNTSEEIARSSLIVTSITVILLFYLDDYVTKNTGFSIQDQLFYLLGEINLAFLVKGYDEFLFFMSYYELNTFTQILLNIFVFTVILHIFRVIKINRKKLAEEKKKVNDRLKEDLMVKRDKENKISEKIKLKRKELESVVIDYSSCSIGELLAYFGYEIFEHGDVIHLVDGNNKLVNKFFNEDSLKIYLSELAKNRVETSIAEYDVFIKNINNT